MTFTAYRNPCTEAMANVRVMASFAQARTYARQNPGLIQMDIETGSIEEAREIATFEHLAAREEYLSTLVGDIY